MSEFTPTFLGPERINQRTESTPEIERELSDIDLDRLVWADTRRPGLFDRLVRALAYPGEYRMILWLRTIGDSDAP